MSNPSDASSQQSRGASQQSTFNNEEIMFDMSKSMNNKNSITTL